MLRESDRPPFSMVPADPVTRLLQQSRLVTSTPLNTKLLFVVRAPFDAGGNGRVVVRQQLADVGRHARLDHEELCEVPGGGRQRIQLFWSSVFTTVIEPDDTISALATTSIASASPPTSSDTSTVPISAVDTSTPSRRSVRKRSIWKVI